jgi:tRNA(Arg) A34 adenosine deaminase TadA
MRVAEHEILIREALSLAYAAGEKGDRPFGAILAIGNRILLSAENSVVSDSDPSRHAELNLIHLAWAHLTKDEIESSTLYASTEPCPMCTGAIYYSRVPRIVYSVSQATLSEITGGSFALPCTALLGRPERRTEVIGPILPEEGYRVHVGYWPSQ